MQQDFAPDAGRPTVISTKLPADLVEIVDFYALRALLSRASWVRDAILDKLRKEVEAYTAEQDVVALASGGR